MVEPTAAQDLKAGMEIEVAPGSDPASWVVAYEASWSVPATVRDTRIVTLEADRYGTVPGRYVYVNLEVRSNDYERRMYLWLHSLVPPVGYWLRRDGSLTPAVTLQARFPQAHAAQWAAVSAERYFTDGRFGLDCGDTDDPDDVRAYHREQNRRSDEAFAAWGAALDALAVAVRETGLSMRQWEAVYNGWKSLAKVLAEGPDTTPEGPRVRTPRPMRGRKPLNVRTLGRMQTRGEDISGIARHGFHD